MKKKILMLATAGLMFTGLVFAQDGKKCGKGKKPSKKEARTNQKDKTKKA